MAHEVAIIGHPRGHGKSVINELIQVLNSYDAHVKLVDEVTELGAEVLEIPVEVQKAVDYSATNFNKRPRRRGQRKYWNDWS